MARAYFDWNATALLRPEAYAATLAALRFVGNPSSIHAEGRAARRLIDRARENVAELVAAEPECVTFTSGGTEANVLALASTIEFDGRRSRRERLLASAIEHPSVRSGGRFAPECVEEVSVGADGKVDLAALERRLAVLKGQGIAPLVSIMHANNETGIIQPIPEASVIVHAAGGLLHVDAVQSAGRIPCNINVLGADLLTLSAHKLGGPKGVGALVRRERGLYFAARVITGGGQERGFRAGTENVAGIAGFGAAASTVRGVFVEEGERTAALRRRFEVGLKSIAPDVVIFGADVQRLPNTTLFAVPGIKAETAVIALDLDGMAVSSGAACSSGKVGPSHVLAAMGVGVPLAGSAIRVSLGPTTTETEIDSLLGAWIKFMGALHKRGNGVAA
jgi:cysteine desulfurase